MTMGDVVLQEDGWTMRQSTMPDIDELMTWFPKPEDINIWGGPSFRFPFTRETFLQDVYFGRMASFSLCDPSAHLVAFGQLYDRDGRMHLARLVVSPAMRRQGAGRRLIDMLMTVGLKGFSGNEYSLFVFCDNTPAYECYKSMGFVVAEYPRDMPHADVCYYLTRPVRE